MQEPEAQATTGTPLELPAFGRIEPHRVLWKDDLFAIVQDKYPVSPGHALIVPHRPVERFSELTAQEKARLLELADWAMEHLKAAFSPAPDGFNLGVNDGLAAGQTVPQFHLHVIPRYVGDVPDPRGGVRWVIASKARYW